MIFPKFIGIGLSVILILFVAFIIFTLWSTWPPSDSPPVAVTCDGIENPDSGPPEYLQPNRPIKILNWNIQFLAGKGYTFFFDVLEGNGKDTQPTRRSIETTLKEVSRFIKEEDPDFVFLQEVDDNAKRTYHEDQIHRLLNEGGLAAAYPCRASAYYWKAKFIPHPKIFGSAGMRLVILSKYRLETAQRITLPLIPGNWFMQQFNLKRVILDVSIRRKNKQSLHLITTHFEAFAQGTELMAQQVATTKKFLDGLEAVRMPWIIAGDFNLLLPDEHSHLSARQQEYYLKETELKPLLEYAHFPSKKELSSTERKNYFTHFPNDPAVTEPDRAIDYFFHSNLVKTKNLRVLRKGTEKISDHYPLVGEFLVE